MSTQAPTAPDEQRRTFACAILSGGFLIAAVVLSRRITGDLTGFRSAWLACGVGIGFLAVIGGSLAFSGLLNRTQDSRFRILTVGGCLLPGVVIGLTLMPASSSLTLSALLSVYFLAVVGCGLGDGLTSIRVGTEADWSAPPTPEQDISPKEVEPETPVSGPFGLEELPLEITTAITETSGFALNTRIDPVEPSGAHPADCPGTTHWMSRSVQDGCEVVEGAFRVEFEPGQKQVAIHLPLAPALPSAPEIECEPVDGDVDVRIRVTSAEAWGVRLEVVRATELEQSQAVQIGYFASAAESQSAAAA